MSALDRIIRARRAPSPEEVLSAALRDLAAAHGRSDIIPMHSEQARRLTLDLAIAAHGECALTELLRGYRLAERHECAVDGEPDQIDAGRDAMEAACAELSDRFQTAAAYHQENGR